MPRDIRKQSGCRKRPAGSALILAVVLTSLLATLGVFFVVAARVDNIATSAVTEQKELDLAIDTVIAKISEDLARDVPGVNTLGQPPPEYYDYPGPKDKWLASLEPYDATGNYAVDGSGDYRWQQISDVNILGTPFLANQAYITHNVPVDPPTALTRIPRDVPIDLRADGVVAEQWADADGDGIADSKWVPIYDTDNAHGRQIYAAIRIIDNSAMLNLNTAYRFDPTGVTDSNLIDGSNQTQINLEPFVNIIAGDTLAEIHDASAATFRDRCGTAVPVSMRDYQQKVIWQMDNPASGYLPFDITDELDLRNRFCINSWPTSRLEMLWNWTVGDDHPATIKKHIYDAATSPSPNIPNRRLVDWTRRITIPTDPQADRRHLLTTRNFDRIIDPTGEPMFNVNGPPAQLNAQKTQKLFDKLSTQAGSYLNQPIEELYAQFAANLVDFADEDTDVTVFHPNEPVFNTNDKNYYGFDAQPFITEVAVAIDAYPETGNNYYAVELYNPFNKELDLTSYTLRVVEGQRFDPNLYPHQYPEIPLAGSIPPKGFLVLVNRRGGFFAPSANICQRLDLRFFGDWIPPKKDKPAEDRRTRPDKSKPPIYIGWEWLDGPALYLTRNTSAGRIYVDRQPLDPEMVPAGTRLHMVRDMRNWRVAYQNMIPDPNAYGSLGIRNGISLSDPRIYKFSFLLPGPHSRYQRPDHKLPTVGDITRVLALGNGTNPAQTIGQQLVMLGAAQENQVRLDLRSPANTNLFKYLTVFDPNSDDIDNDADGATDETNIADTPELAVPGRININTAPARIIEKLPWISASQAQAIVAYRDKLLTPIDYTNRFNTISGSVPGIQQTDIRELPGFETIGELNFVIGGTDAAYRMDRYAIDQQDLLGFPDLTTANIGGDGVIDDFEERDVIFSRISNLATVRSDLYTAYILVRLGRNGPQKRVIAILDRSNVYPDGSNHPNSASAANVKVLTLHAVPETR